MRLGNLRRVVVCGVVVTYLSIVCAARAGVLAPDTPVAGASQAVWGDRWWQWALSYPSGVNGPWPT